MTMEVSKELKQKFEEVKAQLPDDLFNPARLPARDSDGWVSHPDSDLIYDLIGIDDEGETHNKFLNWIGIEGVNVMMHLDDEQLFERYLDSEESSCAYWHPTPPEGDGWLLGWIADSEDGPGAVYLRKAAP